MTQNYRDDSHTQLEMDPSTNLLEMTNFEYSLQDVDQPNLYRTLFNYEEVPKIVFNQRLVPMKMPDHIWITDTTFRDGQQSREPYTTKQIVDLYDMMHRLGGPKGIIRQSEFFLYSKKDRDAVEQCLEKGYEFPEVTAWIRATQDDFDLVKSMGLKETGILVSCSDYHIFYKLRMTRRQAIDHYLEIIEQCIDAGIQPRCHMEDITRADFYGFVVPFVLELHKLMERTGVPIKIRACDTLGYGVSIPGVALPRSIPGIIYGLRHYGRMAPELLEFHGHNDFYRAVTNSTTAWLYGASGVNCSLLGIGERTGNTPLEAMVMEYAALRGTLDGMDPTVITEIADYYKNEIGYDIPPRTPFVGEDFNVTRAGIHADGLLKNEEVYNIFDTNALLKRPPRVLVGKNSGASGIAIWLNSHLRLSGTSALDKHDPLVIRLKEWVDKQYDEGRVTAISDKELDEQAKKIMDEMTKEINAHAHNGQAT